MKQREHEHPFRPAKSIQRGLLSTTSRFVGEYQSDDLAIMLAFPAGLEIQGRLSESPASRSSFVVAFRTSTLRATKFVRPDYSSHLAAVAACMSVLFGKKFDVHGLTEDQGTFRTPDVSAFASICDPNLRFNSHEPRRAYPVKLDLSEFHSIRRLLLLDGDTHREAMVLVTAARFYMQALQTAERDPEVAYLHLITAGEVLTRLFEVPDDVRLASSLRSDLALVTKHVPRGSVVAKRLAGALRGIRRSFVWTLASLLDSDFFDTEDSYCLTEEKIEAHIGAAYDLRSGYVHAGEPFGGVVTTGFRQSFIPGGLVGHANLKATRDAPTFAGMERLIRYATLRCMERQGLLVPLRREGSTAGR